METQCQCLLCKNDTFYPLIWDQRPDPFLEKFKSIESENARLREALSYYATGDTTKTFYGDERYMNLIADQMDISRVGDCWKTGKRAREALEAK